MRGNPDVDIGLAVLCSIQQPHQTFTQKEIAEACGVTTSAIWFLEQRSWRAMMNKIQCDPYLKTLIPDIKKPKYCHG